MDTQNPGPYMCDRPAFDVGSKGASLKVVSGAGASYRRALWVPKAKLMDVKAQLLRNFLHRQSSGAPANSRLCGVLPATLGWTLLLAWLCLHRGRQACAAQARPSRLSGLPYCC